MRKKYPFHGGCLECVNYTLTKGLICKKCQYYDVNWSLPDLSLTVNRKLKDYNPSKKAVISDYNELLEKIPLDVIEKFIRSKKLKKLK
jgi:hypothetical protein